MGKEYLIIEDDAVAERITSEDGKITMVRSNSEIWNSSARGEFVGSLEDTDKDIRITIGKRTLIFDYSDFCDLCDIIKVKQLENPGVCTKTQLVEVNQEH